VVVAAAAAVVVVVSAAAVVVVVSSELPHAAATKANAKSAPNHKVFLLISICLLFPTQNGPAKQASPRVR
jgi:hypothetical protein